MPFGIIFARYLSRPENLLFGVCDPEGIPMRPQPIREIAPPAWPLPLISSIPRGPRYTA
jgi:hypothetical protein